MLCFDILAQEYEKVVSAVTAQESNDAVRSLTGPEDSVQVHYKGFLSNLRDLTLRSTTITCLNNVT